jgi:hypothetical protein
MALIGDKTVDEGSKLAFTVVAHDTNVPAQTLTFSLDPGAPSGASIDPSTGVFSWIPAEVQGPGVYAVTFRVTDNGLPNMSALPTINITVNEVNNAPVLAPILSRTINEGSLLVVTNSATDPDNPPQTLTFSLDPGAPLGMTINPSTGTINWIPSEAQGPGTYSITVRVADDATPPLSDTKTLSVTVNEVNSAPQVSFPVNWTVRAETLLSVSATATDPDLPAQTMTFTLDGTPPAGAAIDPATGLFTWIPSNAQVGTNNMIVRATDSGTPPLHALRLLKVIVLPALHAVISRSADAISISVNTTSGKTYRVLYKNNLADPDWTQLGSDQLANSTTLTFPDTLNASSQRFYRILQVD